MSTSSKPTKTRYKKKVIPENRLITETGANSETLYRKVQAQEDALDEVSIDEITISTMSEKDILTYTVCQLDGEISSDSPIGGVNDPRMGTIEHNTPCVTCGKMIQTCPGHPGRVKLFVPILNPIFTSLIVYVLKSVCRSCGGLLLKEEQLQKKGITRLSDLVRLKRIAELTTKGGSTPCTNNVADPTKNIVPCLPNPNYLTTKSSNPNTIQCVTKISGTESVEYLSAADVFQILDNISDETAEILGFTNGSHPRNMVMRYLVVIPPRARPSTIQRGKVLEDRLTEIYRMIIGVNKKLYDYASQTVATAKFDVDKSIQDLVVKVQHLINNSDGRFKLGGDSEPTKGLVQRIQGKKAFIRKAAMGKRGDFTARSVIGPCPSLRFGQVAVPKIFAKYLTKPVVVTSFNIDELQLLVNTDKVTHITPSTGKYAKRRLISDSSKGFVLNIGDLVERHLMNGDYVLLGRQPTLHKHSMMAYEVVLHDSLNIGIHMSSTTPHNADFDGDEMWIVMPQTLESQIELENVVAFKKNLISGAKSAPIAGAVYDSLVGLFLLTREEIHQISCDPLSDTEHLKRKETNVILDGDFFFDCYGEMYSPESIVDHSKRCEKHNIHPFSGKSLFSLTLPPDFTYASPNGKVIINDGILVKGEITSSTVGAGVPNSIQHVLQRNYGDERAIQFLNEAISIGEKFSTVYGISIGIKDCLFSKEGLEKIKTAIEKAKSTVEQLELEHEYRDPLLEARREGKILKALDDAKSDATKVTEKELGPDNRFFIMAKSGGKGNLPGVTQISGMVGQQLAENKRFGLVLPGNRALPWFQPNDKDPMARGFCARSFYEGLSMPEAFFHAATGRLSLVDMGIKTADTGAFQRRLIKATEDLLTCYDGTVRNGRETIIQYLYGEDGISTEKTSRIISNGKEYETLFDVPQLVRMANAEYLKSIE